MWFFKKIHPSIRKLGLRLVNSPETFTVELHRAWKYTLTCNKTGIVIRFDEDVKPASISDTESDTFTKDEKRFLQSCCIKWIKKFESLENKKARKEFLKKITPIQMENK